MLPVKGRASLTNQASPRFGLPQRAPDADWLDAAPAIDGAPPRLRTQVTHLAARTILSYNRSPDVPFDRSINAYGGCEHGCIYCYARPTHAYHDLSPGLDFETKLFAKPDAARLLRRALARPGYVCAPIALGTNTDPYQPIERDYRLTRQILEICLETRHPVTITTKSDRLLADIDLLSALAAQRLVAVAISVTSLDAALSRQIEPRAATPARRLAALGALAAAGVPAHVSVAPIIPAITDEWLERILEAAAAQGATTASWIMLRLPHEVAGVFRAWLAAHFPDRADKVMGIVQAIRGGADNDGRFFTRMKPQGIWADLFRARFRLAVRRLGLNAAGVRLDTTRFTPPAAPRGHPGQLALF